jgi:hypothetical protein
VLKKIKIKEKQISVNKEINNSEEVNKNKLNKKLLRLIKSIKEYILSNKII